MHSRGAYTRVKMFCLSNYSLCVWWKIPVCLFVCGSVVSPAVIGDCVSCSVLNATLVFFPSVKAPATSASTSWGTHIRLHTRTKAGCLKSTYTLLGNRVGRPLLSCSCPLFSIFSFSLWRTLYDMKLMFFSCLVILTEWRLMGPLNSPTPHPSSSEHRVLPKPSDGGHHGDRWTVCHSQCPLTSLLPWRVMRTPVTMATWTLDPCSKSSLLFSQHQNIEAPSLLLYQMT